MNNQVVSQILDHKELELLIFELQKVRDFWEKCPMTGVRLTVSEDEIEIIPLTHPISIKKPKKPSPNFPFPRD